MKKSKVNREYLVKRIVRINLLKHYNTSSNNFFIKIFEFHKIIFLIWYLGKANVVATEYPIINKFNKFYILINKNECLIF